MKFANHRIQWVLVYFISILGAWFCIDSGHEFGDDFILYIDQAERFWNNFDYQQLQIENKFCMQHSDQLIGPYLYPRGFPFFLSLFIGLKDLWGWETIKYINYLFFLISSVVFFFQIRKRISIKPQYLLIIAVTVLWNPKVWEASDRLQSDLFFASLVMFFWSVWWNEGGSKWVRWILLTVLVFWATLTKSNGVLLLLPIGLQLLVAMTVLIFKPSANDRGNLLNYYNRLHFGSTDLKSRIGFIIGCLGVVFAGLFALWMERNTGANHWKELFAGNIMQTMGSNFIQYWGMLGVLPIWHAINIAKSVAVILQLPDIWIWLPFALLTVGVGIVFIKKGISNVSLEISLYIVFNLILLTIWPSQQGVRMLFPIYPLWILLLFLAVQQLIKSWNKRFKEFLCSNSGRGIILLILFIQGSMTAQHYFQLDTNRAFSKDMVELSRFIRDSTEKESVISFFKPRLLRYQTERHVIRIENTVDYSKDKLVLQIPINYTALKLEGVDYYVVPKEYRNITSYNSIIKKLDSSSNNLTGSPVTTLYRQLNVRDSSSLFNPVNKLDDNNQFTSYPVVFENQQFRVFDLRSGR